MGYEPAWPLCPLEMLGQALALILLLLPKRYQGQGKEAQPVMGWGLAWTSGGGPQGDQSPEPLDCTAYVVIRDWDSEQLLTG